MTFDRVHRVAIPERVVRLDLRDERELRGHRVLRLVRVVNDAETGTFRVRARRRERFHLGVFRLAVRLDVVRAFESDGVRGGAVVVRRVRLQTGHRDGDHAVGKRAQTENRAVGNLVEFIGRSPVLDPAGALGGDGPDRLHGGFGRILKNDRRGKKGLGRSVGRRLFIGGGGTQEGGSGKRRNARRGEEGTACRFFHDEILSKLMMNYEL